MPETRGGRGRRPKGPRQMLSPLAPPPASIDHRREHAARRSDVLDGMRYPRGRFPNGGASGTILPVNARRAAPESPRFGAVQHLLRDNKTKKKTNKNPPYLAGGGDNGARGGEAAFPFGGNRRCDIYSSLNGFVFPLGSNAGLWPRLLQMCANLLLTPRRGCVCRLLTG